MYFIHGRKNYICFSEKQLKVIYSTENFEILISTMNQDSLDFLIPMFPFSHFSNFRILIVNQTQNQKLLISDYPNIRVINSEEKGLSKSRNTAFQNAVGEILLIADDDVVFQEGFNSKIINAYNEFQNAAAIKFCVLKSDGNRMKNYPSVSKKNSNILNILDTSSIEITLNKKKVGAANIQFDEKFGLGSIFEIGEEAIFLSDLKKKGRQIAFVPEIIVKHDKPTSSEKENLIEKYYNQGALFTRIFNKNYIFWIFVKFFFDLKQGKIKLSAIKKLLKSAKNGHKEFESAI